MTDYSKMSVDELVNLIVDIDSPAMHRVGIEEVPAIKSALRKAIIREASVGTLTKTKKRKGEMEWKTNDNLNYHAGIYDIIPRGVK
jgi:hypothetical protein